ncbi:UNVERIFIED_CONTAM: hypothetical protein M9610_24230, partial [Salmonella sp. NW982]
GPKHTINMKTFVVAFLACVAVASAAPSGLGWGLGATLIAPSAAAISTGPLGIGALGLAGPAIIGTSAIAAAPWGLAAPAAIGVGGVGAITAGGGSIAATGHGAAIRGPPTAPVVVAGPSGKIAADGLWGPTANIGGPCALGGCGGKVW